MNSQNKFNHDTIYNFSLYLFQLNANTVIADHSVGSVIWEAILDFSIFFVNNQSFKYIRKLSRAL